MHGMQQAQVSTIRLWDAQTGAALYTQDTGTWTNMVAYAPDGRYFKIQYGVVHLWNSAGQPLGKVPATITGIDKAYWVLGGALLIVGIRDVLCLHDGQSLAQLLCFPNWGYDLFSPVHFLMARRAADRVDLFEMPSGRWLQVVKAGPDVTAAQFSSDGNHLAALAAGGKLLVWNLTPVIQMLATAEKQRAEKTP